METENDKPSDRLKSVIEMVTSGMAGMRPAIEIGSLTGRYYTDWRMELLIKLVDDMVEAFPKLPDLVKIWYDSYSDFHCLSFSLNGVSVVVKFYKVFSSEIDGERGWSGCPRSSMLKFVRHLRDATGIVD